MNNQSNNSGLVWGSLLLGFGLLLLARTLGWLNFDWGMIARFWPILLILGGLNLIVNKSNSRGAVTALCIAFAVPLFATHSCNRSMNNSNWNWDNDESDNNEGNDDPNTKADEETEGEVKNANFSEPMRDNITEATLKFGGGAGKFVIDGTTAQLFEADTKSNLGGYRLTTKRNETDKTTLVDFSMFGKKNLKIENKDNDLTFNNEAVVKLNDRPNWVMDFEIGAGKADFDLSDLKVKNVKLQAGAADIDLKLGSKAANTDLNISSGVASVQIKVPETSGCEVSVSGALNAEDLDGFESKGNGLYRTANFEKATNKITIKFEGGVSKFEVNRY